MPILIGGYQCIRGHNYSVAAQHETTTVGNIERVHVSTKGTTYFYQFSINGVRMDDYSDVCRTPLAPGACNNHGPVLVYYSYQPYANSRLEDFAAASCSCLSNRHTHDRYQLASLRAGLRSHRNRDSQKQTRRRFRSRGPKGEKQERRFTRCDSYCSWRVILVPNSLQLDPGGLM